MKNLIFIALATALFFFTSCSKEHIQPIEIADTPAFAAEKIEPNEIIDDAVSQNLVASTITEAIPTTIRLQVSEVASMEMATTYEVNFTGNYDFSNFTLLDSQKLAYTNNSELNFVVDSYSGSNGMLSVVFLKGGNNLSGLTLALAQEIIVDDLISN